MKPLVYVKRKELTLEERFKYVSEESSDSTDEEWTLASKQTKSEESTRISWRYVSSACICLPLHVWYVSGIILEYGL